MRKTLSFIFGLILIAVCIHTPWQSFSQEIQKAKEDQVAYGIKAGVNFAELFGEDAIPESDRKMGYSLGAYASYKITKDLKIQPEVIWSVQGEVSEKKGRYDISYINIPIMFKWVNQKFYTELGPQLGLQTINSSKSVPDEIRLENFETFDFSFNAGLGYQVNEDLSIGLRYSQGLTNLVQGRDLKNSVIYLGLAYRMF
jgi:long-subunit fatty acid transport protein